MTQEQSVAFKNSDDSPKKNQTDASRKTERKMSLIEKNNALNLETNMQALPNLSNIEKNEIK